MAPESAFAVLADHRGEQNNDKRLYASEYQDHGLVFCQPDGAYYSPDQMGSRVEELIVAVGLEGVSLHSLRHSFASELLSKGTPIPVVSERLRHANPNITLSTYSHAIPADSRAAVKIWDDALADVIQVNRKPLTPRRAVTSQSTSQALPPPYPSVCILLILMVGATGLEPEKDGSKA